MRPRSQAMRAARSAARVRCRVGIIRVRPGDELGPGAAVVRVSVVRGSVGVPRCGKNSAPPGVVV